MWSWRTDKRRINSNADSKRRYTRDITGEIVYLKAYKQMVGEVTEYSTSKNTATVKLCDTGLEITVS